MPTTIIGMYAGGTGGTEDAAANVDVPQDGVITGIDWDVQAEVDADAESIGVELSFIATGQLTQNDVRGRISGVSAKFSLTTEGGGTFSLQKFVDPMDLPVAGGERLYLHIVASAGVVTVARANVHLDTTGAGIRRSARRR